MPRRTVLSNVSVAHPSAKAHALAAAPQDGATRRAVAQQNHALYQQLSTANDHLIPLIHVSHGRVGDEAAELQLLAHLGALVEDKSSSKKHTFVDLDLLEPSVWLFRGNTCIVGTCTAVVACRGQRLASGPAPGVCGRHGH
jgi:hypothetical protein